MIRIRGQDGEKDYHEFVLNFLKLVNHDLIIGLHLMKEIGCLLKFKKGGSYITIGKILIQTLQISEELHQPLDCEIDSLTT